ncbi:hypothetical protein FKP32DRAFT_1600695 [Trametes sanguinea]|nr:hypothetical protein FKP32DRAFT_1600695 [Trametes sanguinea]
MTHAQFCASVQETRLLVVHRTSPDFVSNGANTLFRCPKCTGRILDMRRGTLPFPASEVLRGIAADAPFARNTSQDLQSFLWTIIFIGYHSAIRAAEVDLESESKSPVKIDRRALLWEYHTLFTATSPEELAASRGGAFGSSTPRRPYAGIDHLFRYASAVDEIDGHPDQGLIVLVMGAWSILRRCEPKALVPRRMPSSALQLSSKYAREDIMAAFAAAGASASAPQHPSGYNPSEVSSTLNHDELLQLLGDALKALPPNEA